MAGKVPAPELAREMRLRRASNEPVRLYLRLVPGPAGQRDIYVAKSVHHLPRNYQPEIKDGHQWWFLCGEGLEAILGACFIEALQYHDHLSCELAVLNTPPIAPNRPGRPGKLTVKRVQRIRRLSAEGLSSSEVARNCSISPALVRKIVRRDSYEWVE